MQGYGDLSRIALEADLDVDDLRARVARMSDRALLEFGRAAAYMCSPYANLGQPPRKPFVLQLESARAEWRRLGNRTLAYQDALLLGDRGESALGKSTLTRPLRRRIDGHRPSGVGDVAR